MLDLKSTPWRRTSSYNFFFLSFFLSIIMSAEQQSINHNNTDESEDSLTQITNENKKRQIEDVEEEPKPTSALAEKMAKLKQLKRRRVKLIKRCYLKLITKQST